ILSKLEKNEQCLSLQRSFIMRCLDTIPLDSVVREHIYNNIFTQRDPLPLMESIITKIFWKEEEAINDPFLRILLDPEVVLQASPHYSKLYLKSVIDHIIALHVSIPPDSTPLATYFHKIEACQDTFILTTVSDVESIILSAVITGDGEQITQSVPETVTNFLMALAAAAEGQDNNTNIIESEIDQTRAVDDEYSLSKLPRLWRTINIVNFNSFRAYYNGDLKQYETKYPFLVKKLTSIQRDDIKNIIDFETKQPATIINGKVTVPLYSYICDPSLHIWPPVISELIDLEGSFPSLLTNQAFEAYKYVMDQIE
ncbi:19564_t:CDS:2, partial [Dentiscutata erythropus]